MLYVLIGVIGAVLGGIAVWVSVMIAFAKAWMR